MSPTTSLRSIGFSLAEPSAGTNGTGTCLETRRPTLVVGAEHFVESFAPFTCANTPLIDPISRRMEGTIGFIGPVEQTSPLLLPIVSQLASQIESEILASRSPLERLLLEEFLRHRRRSTDAVVTIGRSVFIATPTARELLAGVTEGELWDRVRSAVRDAALNFDLEPLGRAPIHVRCDPIRLGSELCGASLRLSRRPSTPQASSIRNVEHLENLEGLVGQTKRWQQAVRSTHEAQQRPESVLVIGDRGTGRLAIAKLVAGHGLVETFDTATVLIEGAHKWITRVRDVLADRATVAVRRADQLEHLPAAALAHLVSTAPSGSRVIATASLDAITSPTSPGVAALIDQLDVRRIEVPDLDERREDIPLLVDALAQRLDIQRPVDPRILRTLSLQPWPGNVTELLQVLISSRSRSRRGELEHHHLPSHVRRHSARGPLTGSRRREAATILRAIEAANGNKTDAAELLGISRATLYRRITTYDLRV